jgi:signal transduction histidine kinase
MESLEIHGIDVQNLRANKLSLVERLADDLAHEIKNPLHSMVINLEVLKRRVSRWSGADAADLMRYVVILSDELDRVNRRVDLLLRMVRPERGGELVFLAEAVDELLELVELERDRQGVSIDLRAAATAPSAKIPRDIGRQIILNLLVIAMDAAAPGGAVTITPRSNAKEDLLRILAVPTQDRDPLSPDGVEEDRTRRATVGALAASVGGRIDLRSPPGGPSDATELTFALPAIIP